MSISICQVILTKSVMLDCCDGRNTIFLERSVVLDLQSRVIQIFAVSK